MNRHLLPDEIDLLLDGEVGFGTAPLKSHVRQCAACSAELEHARTLVSELEHLPHLAPSPAFASRVMSRVQVFVPWHVALLDTVRGLVPRSRPARVLAGTGALVVAVALTVVSVWLLATLDTVVFATNLVLDRARDAILSTLASALVASLGEPALQALRSNGLLGLVLAAAVLLVAALIAAGALRAFAVSPRRR